MPPAQQQGAPCEVGGGGASGNGMKGVAFIINGKSYRYTGLPEYKERDFFQVYVKARSGRGGQDVGSVDEAISSFRENIPESDLSDEALEVFFLKHERRRAERDMLAAQQALLQQQPQPPGRQASDPPQVLLPSRSPAARAGGHTQTHATTSGGHLSVGSTGSERSDCRGVPLSYPDLPGAGDAPHGQMQPPIPASSPPLTPRRHRVPRGGSGGAPLRESVTSHASQVSWPSHSPASAGPAALRGSQPRAAAPPARLPSDSSLLGSSPVSLGPQGDRMLDVAKDDSNGTTAGVLGPAPTDTADDARSLHGRVGSGEQELMQSAWGSSAAPSAGSSGNSATRGAAAAATTAATATAAGAAAPTAAVAPAGSSSNPLRKSAEGNAGWAAEPVKKEHTAWEREMMRRQKRQEQERKDREEQQQQQQPRKAAAGPLLDANAPPAPRVASPQPLAAADAPASGGRTAEAKRQAKDRKKEKKDVDSSAAKQNVELQKTVAELQSRLADIEAARTADVAPGAPEHVLRDERDIITLVKRGAAGECLLHAAVEKGSLEDLARLLAVGAVADLADENGRTPFMLAAERGNLAAVHLLSSKGADAGGVDTAGRGAVALAAMGSHAATVEYLCHRGCDPNQPDIYGRTPLHYAVGPRCGALSALLGIDTVNVDARDKILCQTPLHYAAAGGFASAISHLMAAGAVITSDYNGNGPLGLAAMAGHRDAVAELVRRTASARRWSALHECIISGGDLPATAMSGQLGGTPGAPDIEVDEPDAAGQTPIFLATITPRTENVDYILSLRADLSVKDKMKRTVLHYVAARGQLHLCRTLLRAGGFTDEEDESFLTPYQLATLRGHRKLAALLLDYGAAHNVHSSFERLCEVARRQAPSSCPLVSRAHKRDIARCRIAADAAVIDEHGRTALHTACLVGDEDGVRYLLQRALRGEGGPHCSITATDNRGWTVLHYAACRDGILDDERNDLSAMPLTQPSAIDCIKLEATAQKTAHQIRIVKMLLVHNMSLQSQGLVPNHADLRALRDHAGRLPVDVAKREGADPDVVTLLHPSARLQWFLHTAPRWALLVVMSMLWGIFLSAPIALCYTLTNKPLKSTLTRPFNSVIACFDSTRDRVKRCLRGESHIQPTEHWKNYNRLFRLIAWLGVALCFLLAALLPYWIVAAHNDVPEDYDGLNDLMINATRGGADAGSSSPLMPGLGGGNATDDVASTLNATDAPGASPLETNTRGKVVRNAILSILGIIIFMFSSAIAARVYLDRTSSQLAPRMVARKPNFGKAGNWVAVLLGILDLLMFCAVPFVIVRGGGGEGVAALSDGLGGGRERVVHHSTEREEAVVPLALRYLVWDAFDPDVSLHVGVAAALAWLCLAGFSSVSAAVSSNPALARKFGVVQPHSFSTVLPFLTHFLAHTLFIPVVLSAMRVYKCAYAAGAPPYIVGAPDTQCYSGRRAASATLAMVLVMGYAITAVSTGVLVGEPHSAVTDIVWGRHLLAVEKCAMLLMSMVATIWYEMQWLCEIVCLLALFVLVVFQTTFHCAEATNALPFIHQWRVLAYAFAGVALIIAVVFYSDAGAGEPEAGTIISAVMLFAFLVLAWGVYRYSLQKHVAEQRAQAFRQLSASRGGAFATSQGQPPGPTQTGSFVSGTSLAPPVPMTDVEAPPAPEEERVHPETPPQSPGYLSNFGLSFDASHFVPARHDRSASPPSVGDGVTPMGDGVVGGAGLPDLADDVSKVNTVYSDPGGGGAASATPRGEDDATAPVQPDCVSPPLEPDGWVLVGLAENMPQLQSYHGWVV